jgi:hypothetical protein
MHCARGLLQKGQKVCEQPFNLSPLAEWNWEVDPLTQNKIPEDWNVKCMKSELLVA